MAEYIDRYDSMARWFASRGYAVYGNDHIGHGLSVTPNHPLGDLGGRNQDGEIFVKDVKTLSDMAKKENPGKPFYLFGHSMGSFIGRCYAAEYGDSLTAAIFCGSGMVPPETCEKLGEAIEHVGMIQPENKFDQAVADIMAVTGSTDWLSVNQKNQDDYKADPLCGFAFTIRGYGQSLELIAESCDPETIGETPKDLPMFFISGSKDPVGLYGVGFNAMVNAYTKDHTKVSSKLYEGYKHEIHNDDCKDEVYADILAFIQANK